jgi:hypothetical protein
MEKKKYLWNVRMSETERKRLAELARRLNVKEASAVRYAVTMALEATDPQKNPNALKNIVVIA